MTSSTRAGLESMATWLLAAEAIPISGAFCTEKAILKREPPAENTQPQLEITPAVTDPPHSPRGSSGHARFLA
jgi:hypothetical protein